MGYLVSRQLRMWVHRIIAFVVAIYGIIFPFSTDDYVFHTDGGWKVVNWFVLAGVLSAFSMMITEGIRNPHDELRSRGLKFPFILGGMFLSLFFVQLSGTEIGPEMEQLLSIPWLVVYAMTVSQSFNIIHWQRLSKPAS